jgi:hypothetical protein
MNKKQLNKLRVFEAPPNKSGLAGLCPWQNIFLNPPSLLKFGGSFCVLADTDCTTVHLPQPH